MDHWLFEFTRPDSVSALEAGWYAASSNKCKGRLFQFLGDADCGSTPSSLMFSTTFDRNIPAEGREKLEKSPLAFVTRHSCGRHKVGLITSYRVRPREVGVGPGEIDCIVSSYIREIGVIDAQIANKPAIRPLLAYLWCDGIAHDVMKRSRVLFKYTLTSKLGECLNTTAETPHKNVYININYLRVHCQHTRFVSLNANVGHPKGRQEYVRALRVVIRTDLPPRSSSFIRSTV